MGSPDFQIKVELMSLSRRIFLRNSALAMVGVGAAPLWLQRAALRRRRARFDGKKYSSPSFSAARPTVSISLSRMASSVITTFAPRFLSRGQMPPLPADSAIDLDGFFGLHPSLASLKPLWDRQELAIVHAAGSPDPTRSHFDAQDYMESGTPGLKATSRRLAQSGSAARNRQAFARTRREPRARPCPHAERRQQRSGGGEPE